MNPSEFRQQTKTGWNTWNTESVLSHVCLPYGFMIGLSVKDYTQTGVLKNALIGRFGEQEEHLFPGIRSWDGTYTTFEMEYCTTRLTVESTAQNGEQVILVTPNACSGYRPPTLIVEAGLLWGKEGTVSKKEGILCGDFPDGRHISVFLSVPSYPPAYGWTHGPACAVDLTGPVVISTTPCSAAQARVLLDSARQTVLDAAASYGVHAEAYTAMKSCLAWDTVYEPQHDRICSPVSRIWNCSWGGYVLFDWDTYFAALMASVDHKELAYLNALAITEEVTEEGFVPNFGSADNCKSRDRSQPPVGAMVVLEIFRKYREEWFVRAVYPTLLTWNRWFARKRMTREGYLCWGSNRYEPVCGRYFETHLTGDRQGAAFESGLDNSPMYDDMAFDEKTELSQLADVGLMGLYIKDCASLAALASAIGADADIPELLQRKEKTENALMTLWNEEDGIFENKDLITGKLSQRFSPTNFYSLYSDQVTDAQKSSMLKRYFYNPDFFWGDYMLPSIARNDPGYPDQNYWRGRIWAPMNLLVYFAFKEAGLNADARVLAEKSEQLLLKEWRAHGHVHENYSGDDGWGCGVGNSDKFYHWGGLLGYIVIDAEKSL